MKKLFISQPMSGKADEEILAERKVAIKAAEELLREPVEVIDSLSDADIAYFAKDWQKARGCKIEHERAVEYGIPRIDHV